MDTVIFDLDGTLADTSGDLIAAANACFRQLGFGDLLDARYDKETAFKGSKAMLRLGFSRADTDWSEADVDEQYPLVLDYYGNNIDRFTTVYDGAYQALTRLRDAGCRLGVCTNKQERFASALLESLDLAPYFGAMIGADGLAVRKPDPEHLLETIRRLGGDPARSVLIGDTLTDRKTAAAAAVPCILVNFGPLGPGVAEMLPEATLDHYDDLPGVLSGLGLDLPAKAAQ